MQKKIVTTNLIFNIQCITWCFQNLIDYIAEVQNLFGLSLMTILKLVDSAVLLSLTVVDQVGNLSLTVVEMVGNLSLAVVDLVDSLSIVVVVFVVVAG